ncbi:MAG: DNA repair protein RadA [Patescibacteria group bacterium]|jgi:DNA repair protein RadA/Sms|nr:DNA repair protein RadA [Patescibacteria group bacterium]
MTKISEIYVCEKCGAQHPKWSGRCLECGSWSSLKKELQDRKTIEKKETEKISPAVVVDFNNLQKEKVVRSEVGISEVDRVFGGGLVSGSLVLFAGEPGIGKSTLLTQISDSLAKKNKATVLYISGEESSNQVKDRFVRLKCDLVDIKFVGDTNLEKIISAIKEIKPSFVVVDSIQTIYSSMIPSESGSVTQIRACTSKFMELSKETGISVILVGHITKDGNVAGPKTLEHMVDVVVYLETDNSQMYRMMRTTKNRFGSTNEIGIFEMKEDGFTEVKNPSSVFINDELETFPGSVVSSLIEGTRSFLVEIQALVSKTMFGYPQRKSSGFDLNRLQVLSAVLSKRTSINLFNQDIILNSVGGIKINDPALDLAVCLSIASSFLDKSLKQKTIILGEVGLGGEVRNVSHIDARLKEAEKLGFEKAIIPDMKTSNKKLLLVRVKNLPEAIKNI